MGNQLLTFTDTHSYTKRIGYGRRLVQKEASQNQKKYITSSIPIMISQMEFATKEQPDLPVRPTKVLAAVKWLSEQQRDYKTKETLREQVEGTELTIIKVSVNKRRKQKNKVN
jgi:hypothetical protein